MGTDKALLAVGGVPMAGRVVATMRSAGAGDVLAVGGDAARLSVLGVRVVADLEPGQGPLAGIISALDAADDEVVVVSACDMPWLEPAHLRMLVDALDDADVADVAVGAAGGRLQPLLAAWRARARPQLREAFDRGERAPRRVLPEMSCAVVELGEGRWHVDLDTPADLAVAVGT
jgi:molybdopterin-guanine dinucleotide biosynthesis protein A